MKCFIKNNNMKTINENSGECPCCGEQTKQDNEIVFCEKCGFSITNSDNNPPKSEETVLIDF